MTAIIGGFKGKTLVSLGRQSWSASANLAYKIPQDIVAKELIVVVNGSLIATFDGSGTLTKPVVNQWGLSHGLIDEMFVSRKGTDRVKSFKGTRQLVHTVERQFGTKDGSLYAANAATLASVTQGLPVFPATTQVLTFRESNTIMMENKLSGSWYPTLFNTKDLQTAQLNIKCASALSAIIDPDDTSTAAITSNGITIEVFASCCDYLLDSPDLNQADWIQNYEELEFSGAQNKNKHRISPQGMLQGVLITGLHTGNKPFSHHSMSETKLEIKYMGILIAEGSMADFLEVDSVKTMLTSRQKGSCYVSFLNNDKFDSGLFIADGKQLELIITTDSALTYTTPVKLRFEYDQIIFAPTAQAKV